MAGLMAVAALAAAPGCAFYDSFFGTPADPVPTIKVQGTQERPRALVVVLPGFIYDADDLREVGVADALHRGWPEADVMLVGATYPYYRSGLLVARLRENVIRPARAQGYTDIWLAGGSMGGMGVLLYEATYPGELDGLVLLSPFLGSDAVIDPIRETGLAEWDPGELTLPMDGDNYQLHVWNMIKGWRRRPELARRVWLVCGTEDSLFRDAQVLGPELPQGQYLPGPGGHNWDFWLPAAEATFRQIASRRA